MAATGFNGLALDNTSGSGDRAVSIDDLGPVRLVAVVVATGEAAGRFVLHDRLDGFGFVYAALDVRDGDGVAQQPDQFQVGQRQDKFGLYRGAAHARPLAKHAN